MLDALKNLNYSGGKEGLIFFFCEVLKSGSISIRDAEIICSHATEIRNLSVRDILHYCIAFGWVQKSEEIISVTTNIQPFLSDREKINSVLIESTVENLFSSQILSSDMFSYDAVGNYYSFRNELLPLSFSCVRNVLISQGFIIPIRDDHETRFYIEPLFESYIAKQCRTQNRQLTLDRLKKQLEINEISGEKAELFVISYEKKRIGRPLCEKIRRISEIDVTAGYDILSYNSEQSLIPDRYIEVKAVSKTGFFWSKNEFEVAKLLGNRYYLYLVDLSSCNYEAYQPLIICDPAKEIMFNDDWLVETQNYHIMKTDSNYRNL